jgi:hypothetical protein
MGLNILYEEDDNEKGCMYFTYGNNAFRQPCWMWRKSSRGSISARYGCSAHGHGAGRGTADLTFTIKDDKIHLSIYWVYTNEEIDQTYIMESKGFKID